jgi:hypothetical protein
MLRWLNTLVIAAMLASAPAPEDAAFAGAPSALSIAGAAGIHAPIDSIHWTRSCNCRRHWVGRHRYASWQHRHPVSFGSCRLWRATHWGIGRVWSCYYLQ